MLVCSFAGVVLSYMKFECVCARFSVAVESNSACYVFGQ